MSISEVSGEMYKVIRPEQKKQGHHRCGTKYGVGEHVDDDMRGEPRALQGGHQRLVVDLRLEEVHADEHQGKDGRER